MDTQEEKKKIEEKTRFQAKRDISIHPVILRMVNWQFFNLSFRTNFNLNYLRMIFKLLVISSYYLHAKTILKAFSN